VAAIQEDQIIQADFLAGPARVKKFEQRAAYTLLEVTIEGSGEYRSLRLTSAQVEQIERVEQNPAVLSSDPEEFFLLIEAHRIRLAYQFDPLLAVSVSQVDPLPHQIEAVYHHALEMPHLRFMIADDPGAGKTVMAGLILKEMQYRGLVERVLIVAPGHLKYQWQRELKEKFSSSFRLIDRDVIRAHWGENVWAETPLGITSIDFLKQDDIKARLTSARWDMIIVDEAHKMSAYAYETKEQTKIDKTKRYQVGEILSRQTDHLLFLTATPHRGDEENFRLFLDLLRPGFFANKELLKQSVEKQENPLFIRRLKEDMLTFDGKAIFPPRTVQTVRFRLTDPEMRLYNAVTEYVQSYYDKARENRNVTFAMVILQRRLTSSTNAILSSLERRKARMEELLKLPEKIQQDDRYDEVKRLSAEDLEDLSEEDRWEAEELLEHLTIARNIEDVRREIRQLTGLIEEAERVKALGTESKLVKLRDEILSTIGDKKLLIFTEHKDTLWYLEERLRTWGYEVTLIHGGMQLDARIEAERTFKNHSQIMVATEAAGEGINLQFCSLMVNYDIPWNPNRLEQRMGRIHRYGQTREVFIWNLIAENTREGQILDRLFEKLDRMRLALGTDRVFDIIGDLIPGANLSDLLKDAIFNQRHMEEITEQIEAVDEENTRETLERVFLSSLATRHIDYTGLQLQERKAEENRLVPEYVEDFFLRAFSHVGGRMSVEDNGYRIEHVPLKLREYNDDLNFRSRFGTVARDYRCITFDKGAARRNSSLEFVAPGHPLLEALNERILTTYRQQQSSFAAFSDPTQQRTGALWFVEGIVRDGASNVAGRRVFAVLQNTTGELTSLNPAVLWDLEVERETEIPPDVQELLQNREAIEDHLVEHVLFPYQAEIAKRREKDGRIKERYGLKSLDYLIAESNQKILDYELRESGGQDMRLALQQERRNLEKLEARREQLEDEIRLERNVIVDEPRILGAAALIPAEEPHTYPTPDGDPKSVKERPSMDTDRRDEVEAVGMRVATAYEEAQGRMVEDVSEADHGGFDLRSIQYTSEGTLDHIRYIEVKARARSGSVRISSNEWKMARRYKDDYWLYVVTEADSNKPNLKRIANPAARFQEGQDIFATGFQIPEAAWKGETPADD